MILTNNSDYSKPHIRQEFAKFLSTTIEGAAVECLPYKPNENKDDYWTLDVGNNWKVKFFDQYPKLFEIIYRYNSTERGHDREMALANWLQYRINAQFASI